MTISLTTSLAAKPTSEPDYSATGIDDTLLNFDPHAEKAPTPPKPALGSSQPVPENGLPVPYDLQAVRSNEDVALSWTWQPAQRNYVYKSVGFEVQRDSTVLATVTQQAYTDRAIPVGHHSYRARAVGKRKIAGKWIKDESVWSEPSELDVAAVCSVIPSLTLQAEPIQNAYSPITSLRFHMYGTVTAGKYCTLRAADYHIESNFGSKETGKLPLDAKGRYDFTVHALSPNDEVPAGNAIFTVTITADNENGSATSEATTVNLEKEDPFAPHH